MYKCTCTCMHAYSSSVVVSPPTSLLFLPLKLSSLHTLTFLAFLGVPLSTCIHESMNDWIGFMYMYMYTCTGSGPIIITVWHLTLFCQVNNTECRVNVCRCLIILLLCLTMQIWNLNCFVRDQQQTVIIGAGAPHTLVARCPSLWLLVPGLSSQIVNTFNVSNDYW